MLRCVVYKSALIPCFSVTLTLALLSLSVSSIKAQYRYDVWTTDNGLPQNSVNAILQTRDGYLWLATNDGLVRYDGARFTVFNRGNTPGIESNRFTALCEDRDGNLWIGTAEERLTKYRDGVFTTYALKEKGLRAEMIEIDEDQAGGLWITTLQGILQWKHEQFSSLSTQGFTLNTRSEPASRGHVWWKQNADGLQYIVKGQVITLTPQDGLPNKAIDTVVIDYARNIWLSMPGYALVKVKDHQLTFYLASDGWPTGGRSFEDREGHLWVWGEGLSTRASNGRVISYPSPGSSLSAAAYVDREGTMWLASGNGLFHACKSAMTSLTLREGLFSGLIYTIFQDRAHAVWLGSGGGGVSRLKDGAFTHYFSLDVLFATQIMSLYEDRDGCLWIGSDRGMSQFKDGKMTRYSNEHGLAGVLGMHQDRAGNMWFATGTGLTKYQDGHFTVYTMRDGLANNDLTALLEDHAGALWIGSSNGLTRYADGRFTTWTEKDGFPHSQIRTLYEDRDGVLWIGTYDSGLFRFKDGRFIRYTTQEGLFNNGVFQILEDARGNFWMSSNLGIYRVRRQELNDFAEKKIQRITSIAYGKKDGMPNNECNGGRQPAGWKMRDGKLWFPTMDGVAIVDPEAIPLNTVPPPVVIEDTQLNNEKTDVRDGVITVPPDKNYLEIHYTALSFINSEHLRFKYQLAGLDRDWVDAGTRRVAYYPQLPPGTYTFTVTAANSDGVWNEQGQSLKIIVLPPFWRTWWFITLEVLTMIGAALLLHQNRIRHLQRARAAQEAFSRRLIDSQEQERKRIAEGLHDSLAQYFLIIKNRADLGLLKPDNQDKAQEHFDEISSLSAQAIEEVREIAHDLRPYQLDRFGLTKAIEAMLKKVAASSSIAFSSDLAPVDGELSKEAEINLYRIAQESINNIVRHSRATEAKVEFQRNGQSAQLIIQDNGQGFAYEATVDSHTQGFGLNNMAERARLLGGKLTIRSFPGQGTTITLTFSLANKPENKPLENELNQVEDQPHAP